MKKIWRIVELIDIQVWGSDNLEHRYQALDPFAHEFHDFEDALDFLRDNKNAVEFKGKTLTILPEITVGE